MENGNNGFVLSEELTALREQVKRIIRDEIIPIEDRLDPDAAEIPEERVLADRAQNPGRRAVVHGRADRNTAAADSALSTCAC